jgi:hypothetical protein
MGEVRRALEMDFSLAEVHAMLGMVPALYGCEWQEGLSARGQVNVISVSTAGGAPRFCT